MTDHHDFGFDDHHDPVPFDDHHDLADPHPFGWEEPHPYEDHADLPETHGADAGHDVPDHDEPVAENHGTAADPYHIETAETHPEHDVPDVPEASVEVFPPPVDVGDLPEPVDGFPWIDTGSLGIVHPVAAADLAEPVHPQEIAEYAATELPPAVDPWAALADSDDPATSALARWWSEN